jgi:ABC-type transport system involved in multi-copper enzyme maturation permease subunit
MKRRWANLGLPLLSKELAEMAQLRRTYVMRVAFAVLLLSTSVLLILPTYRELQGSPRRLMGHGAQFLDLLYAVEWGGLVLFVPAIVSGALTAEKERNTLQLLFLTRLGPWTILLEKLLSRLVPVATFLLVSLPLVFIAYLWGGLTQDDLEFAVAELVVTAFLLASIALFCSAYCATSASAFILSYVITAFVFVVPILLVFGIFFGDWLSRRIGAGRISLASLLDAPGNQQFAATVITSTLGINLEWVTARNFRPVLPRPFHTTPEPLVVIPVIGVLFLFLARRAVVLRAVPQPEHHIRRLFVWLDRTFTRLNDRYAKGILLANPDNGLPEDNPVLWRENRRGNLGRVNYLIRVVLLLESPFLIVSALSAGFLRNENFSTLGTVGLCLWPIALLIVIVRSAGLIAGEKARQTLDVLLTTPLSVSELVGAKMQGLRRVMAIVAVPIVFQTLLLTWLRLAVAQSFGSDEGRQIIRNPLEALSFLTVIGLNLLTLFWLAAELAFLFGLYAKTQGRAVTSVVVVFAALCFLPVMVRLGIWEKGAWDLLYLSPIADILVSEFPWFGIEWERTLSGVWWGPKSVAWKFHPLLHCALYAVIVLALAAINRWLAGRVLLRSKSRPTPALPLLRVPQLAQE